jgi:hypothetical protein
MPSPEGFFVLTCSICGKRCEIENCKVDEVGHAVHAECYAAMMTLQNAVSQRVLTPNPVRKEELVKAALSGNRCPYCVEGGHFKLMIEQSGGDRFVCANCGHLAMPNNPLFTCTCAHCVRVESAGQAGKQRRISPLPRQF